MEYEYFVDHLYKAVLNGNKNTARIMIELLIERRAEKDNLNIKYTPITVTIEPDPPTIPKVIQKISPPPPSSKNEINNGAEAQETLPIKKGKEKAKIDSEDKKETTNNSYWNGNETISWAQSSTQSEENNIQNTTYAQICKGTENENRKQVTWAEDLVESKTETCDYNQSTEKRFKLSGYQTNQHKKTYWCGCNARKLKNEFEAYKQWKGKDQVRAYDFHCCKCYRPGRSRHFQKGNEEYHQLCEKCAKRQNYDETEEPWYNQPCIVCDEICEGPYNIHGSIFTGHYPCKYAYLAVQSANSYAHVAQRIDHYINSTKSNCTATFAEIAPIAKAYYKKKYPQDITDDNERAYHNTLSFNEQYQRHWNELIQANDDYFDENAVITNEEHQNYIDALNNSFEENREAILERLSHKVDLTQSDPIRFGHGGINLCHECLMPYETKELEKEGIRLLCKEKGPNGKTCHESYLETKAQKASTSRSAWDN
jgi:hypothetical protein